VVAAPSSPVTEALGPRATLGVSGLATILLGIIAAAVLLARRRVTGRPPAGPRPA
jgi:hypothetical protein